jgi:DNA-binding transcriptional ArsR family regulator
MQLKSFTTLAGLGVTALAAVVLALFRTFMEGPPLWAIAVGCGGVIALAAWWWHGEFGRGETYIEFSSASRRAMAHTITFAALAHCVWLLWTLADLGSWKAHVLTLIGMALAEWVVAAAWDYRLTHLLPPVKPVAEVEVFEPTLVSNEQPHLRTADDTMQRILERGGWPYVLVTEVNMLPDGHKGATFECLALSPRAAFELTGKEVTKVEPLALGQEERLAGAAQEELGRRLKKRWVRIQETEYPGLVRATIALEDIFAKPLKYELNNELLPRGSHITIGTQVHGEPVMLNPYQHMVICGATQSGKTSLVNVVIAELLRLPGRVQVCGKEKIYDIAGQWLDPHLGTDNDLPLDWVVQGLGDTLKMLASAMLEARWRQNLDHHDRVGIDPLWVVVEEAPAVLNDRDLTVNVEGHEYFASELAAHNTRTTTSSEVYFVFLAQEYDNAMFGDAAASIKANSNAVMIMRSRAGDERSRAFGRGGAAMPNLHHPGEFYIQDGAEPYAGKAPYIQEADPRKPRLHNGPTLAEVSIARSQLVAARSQGRMAPPSTDYAERPKRMTDEYRKYLQAKRSLPAAGSTSTQAPVLTAADPVSQVDAAIAAMEAQLDQRDSRRLHIVDSEPKQPGPRQQIADLVREAGREMSRAEIIAALEDVSESSIDNHLSELVRQGRLARVPNQPGVYISGESAA